MLVAANVNGGREVAYALSALGCLFVAAMLIMLVLATRPDRGGWSRLRRSIWTLGAVAGSVVALAGVGFVGLWASGADWSLHSSSSASGANFCDAHDCIPNFDNGRGSIVQCVDGTYSHSGGIQGACSDHGGVG
jgi:hypothetical protein